jgi:hypothetical protein
VLLRLLPAQLCILAGVDTSGYLVQQYARWRDHPLVVVGLLHGRGVAAGKVFLER